MKNKKTIPLRKCTGCNQMKEKDKLIRIVRTLKGQYCIDSKGTIQGRGAYICLDRTCMEKAEKQRGLERSFKSSIDRTIYEALRKEFEGYYGA